MKRITCTTPINEENTLGVQVEAVFNGHDLNFDVEISNKDEYSLSINGKNQNIPVSDVDFVCPTLNVSKEANYCRITFGSAEVHIALKEEGVFVDTYHMFQTSYPSCDARSRTSGNECHYCGQISQVTAQGVSHHVDENGNIDHNADADHVACTM